MTRARAAPRSSSGSFLLVLALFLSGSVQTLFGILPKAIHGVILFLTGAQLALGSCDFSKHEGRGSIYDRTVPSFFHLKTPISSELPRYAIA